MDFEKRLKDIAWTGMEITVIIAGASISQKFLNDEKLFKKKYESNPEWFEGKRDGAPFLVKWSGGIKAGVALLALQHVKNPWLKLGFMGVAFQGILQQARVLTWKEDHELQKIGAHEGESIHELDTKLRNMAHQHRIEMGGTEYINGENFVGAYGNDYSTQVAGLVDEMGNPVSNEYGSRYKTQVAGTIFDEGDYHYRSSDRTQVH
jgi:hypothetical protein